MQVKIHLKIVQMSVLITPLGMHQDYRGLNLCASGSSSDNSNRKNNRTGQAVTFESLRERS